MKTYGQFCPVAKAAEVFCERWTPLILRELATGSMHFAEIQRGVPLASPTLISRRLKQLEAEGVVERRKTKSGKTWTYHLTPAGEEFAPIIEALGTWGQRWTRRDLQEHEVSLDLLLWAMEKSVNPNAFDKERSLVQLDLTDQPVHRRTWWFLNEGDRCELCLKDTGHEVDAYLACTLRDMIHIWRGELSIRDAISTERLLIHGKSDARRAVPDWLGVSTLAHVKPQRSNAGRKTHRQSSSAQ